MKLNTGIILLFIGLITGCNFSENNADSNNPAGKKSDSNAIAEEIKNKPEIEDKNDTMVETTMQQTTASPMVIFNSVNFQEKVLKCNKPVLVFFRAGWCGPCRMVGPVIDEIAREYEGKAVIGKLDTDENADIADKYGVHNIPTILIFKNGQVVDKQVGAVEKAIFCRKLDAQLTL